MELVSGCVAHLPIMQCLRYELKHTLAKRLAAVNCNFKNICKIVATKYQVLQSAAWSEKDGPWIEFECTGGYMTPVANLDGSETTQPDSHYIRYTAANDVLKRATLSTSEGHWLMSAG